MKEKIFKGFWNYNYLKHEDLSNLTTYKYSCVDSNPLSIYICQPYWNFMVKFCPRWIAPNLLTFIGFILSVIGFLVLSFYDYSFSVSTDNFHCEPIPKWIWLFTAFMILGYYTLDGIDGKHARQIGSSNALGELFDHGLDSWSAFFIPISAYSVFGKGEFSISPERLFLILWIVFLCFYFSHWEKYITGVLYLPWGYDLSILVIIMIYLVTFVFDCSIFKFCIETPFGKIFPTYVIEAAFWLGVVCFSLPISLRNVYRHYMENSIHHLSILEALKPISSLGIFLIVSIFWGLMSPSKILYLDLRMYCFLTGTIFSNICLTNTHCELVNLFWFPFVIAIMLVFIIGNQTFELATLYLLTVFVTLMHIHFGICVINQICCYLQVRCFKVKEKSSLNVGSSDKDISPLLTDN